MQRCVDAEVCGCGGARMQAKRTWHSEATHLQLKPPLDQLALYESMTLESIWLSSACFDSRH